MINLQFKLSELFKISRPILLSLSGVHVVVLSLGLVTSTGMVTTVVSSPGMIVLLLGVVALSPSVVES